MTMKSDSVAKAWRDTPSSALSDFLARKSAQTYTKTIDPTRITNIVSEHGLRFTFPAFCLRDEHNNLIHSEVQLHIREVFSKQDMILTNRMATSEDRLLESAGQFLIYATHKGTAVELCAPVCVEMPIKVALSNRIALKLFSGGHPNMQAFHNDNFFDWKQVNDKTLKIKKLSSKNYFQFHIHAFNWYGCHYFYTKRKTVKMASIKCDNDLKTFDDQAAFLVFEDISSVVRMYHNHNKNCFTALNIPENLAAKVVLIGLKEEQLYFGVHRIDSISSQTIAVSMNPTSESNLLEALFKL